jgi:hypothetical protein
MAGALRSLKQRRLQPVVPARDWGDAVAALAGGCSRFRHGRPRPSRSQGEEAEPAEIIRWIDEIDDAEMNEEIERLVARRRASLRCRGSPGRGGSTSTSRMITR